MSCFLILMENGHKVARSVTSREEYLALRGSKAQEENLREARNGNADAKRRLVQMNYSCLPNDDGTLKGATRMSNTVGMDVDFDPSSPDYDRMMAEAPAKILAQKDVVQLLMLERSVNKGYHVVFRRQKDMSNEGNLAWASTLLGMQYDKGAKDITRVFFTTGAGSDDLIYLDDELFSQESAEGATSNTKDAGHTELFSASGSENDSTNGQSSNVTSLKDSHANGSQMNDHSSEKLTSSSPLGERAGSGATEASSIAFDLCVKQAGLSPDSMDIWGEHNWHNNLLAVLSTGLPKLMTKDQLKVVVREKLLNYGQTDDCNMLIDYFYDNYSAGKGYMSASLRDINAQSQLMAQSEAKASGNTEDAEYSDAEIEELTEGWNPPALPKKCPRIMNLLVGNYDPRFREMLMLSSLPELAALASHYRARYLNGKLSVPNTFVNVIGGSGSGKGNCSDLFDEITKYTIKAHDDSEWKKLKENMEERDKKANAKDRPAKYHPKIRIFETTSKTSILELQTNLGPNGMLLGKYTEADAMVGSFGASFSDISVLLRKSWDGDIYRQFYMSDSSCNTSIELNVSLMVTGTPKAIIERMFTDKNCENGFMQRFIPVLVPKMKRTFRPPMQNFLSDDEKQERDALIMKLYQQDLELGDDIKILDTPMTNRAIGKWYDDLEVRYNNGLLTEAEADLSHRCGEFMLRAVIPLVALYGEETKEIVDFAVWVGEMAFYNMCRIFGHRVQRDINDANELLADHSDARKTASPLLDKMPNIFTKKDFEALRVKEGQSKNANMFLTRCCKEGKLIRIGRGVYQKRNIITVTKEGDPKCA